MLANKPEAKTVILAFGSKTAVVQTGRFLLGRLSWTLTRGEN